MPAKNKTTKYYGVQSGHVPGVYTDWGTAEAQIRGWKGPRFRAFPTHAEAQAFVDQANIQPSSNSHSTADDPSQPSPSIPAPQSDEGDIGPPAAKRRKKETPTTSITDFLFDPSPGDDDLPPGAEDGFDPRLTLNPVTGKIEYKTDTHLQKTKWQATGPVDNTPLRIYTDGSALGNGAHGAVAGVGVYFGPQDPKNVSEALAGTRQTNQRAELTAVLRALELSPRNRMLHIYTDSNYAIKCVTEWFVKWRENGWLNSAKKPVENKDLVEKILGLLEERHRIGGSRTRVEFVWVKGHAADVGNNAADELAVAGAREAKELIAMGAGPSAHAED